MGATAPPLTSHRESASHGRLRRRRGVQVPPLEARSPARLWPNLRAAARLLEVSASSLSRQELPVIREGKSDRLAPHVVLAAARYYCPQRLGSVAAELVELARPHAADRAELQLVEIDVDAYLDLTRRQTLADPWLEEARRRLSPDAYSQVIRDLGLDAAE